MADKEAPKTDAASVTASAVTAAGSTFDPITKFGEGIAQTLRDLVTYLTKDRKVWEIVVFFFGGRIVFNDLMDKITDLAKEDGAERMEARLEAKLQLIALYQELGEEWLKKGLAFYAHIKGIGIPDADDMIQNAKARGEIWQAKEQAAEKAWRIIRWPVLAAFVLVVIIIVGASL